MKRVLVPGVLVLLLAMSACSETQTPPASDVQRSAQDAGSAAPLTAESPAATAVTGDAAFLEEVRAKLRPDNVIPNATDEQLLEAGQKACEGIAAGADTLTLSLIDGEQPDASGFYPDSGVIIRMARANLC